MPENTQTANLTSIKYQKLCNLVKTCKEEKVKTFFFMPLGHCAYGDGTHNL